MKNFGTEIPKNRDFNSFDVCSPCDYHPDKPIAQWFVIELDRKSRHQKDQDQIHFFCEECFHKVIREKSLGRIFFCMSPEWVTMNTIKTSSELVKVISDAMKMGTEYFEKQQGEKENGKRTNGKKLSGM